MIPPSMRNLRADIIEAALAGVPARKRSRKGLERRQLVDAEGMATEAGRAAVAAMGAPAEVHRPFMLDRNDVRVELPRKLRHPDHEDGHWMPEGRWTEAARSIDGRTVYLIRGWHEALAVLAEAWDHGAENSAVGG